MKLVEEGRLALDTDIGTYLGYEVRNPHFPRKAVTLRMLLSHTSSFATTAATLARRHADPRGAPSRRKAARHGRHVVRSRRAGRLLRVLQPQFRRGRDVMEKVTGERFDRLMRRLVLDPLGMRGGFNPAEMPRERVGTSRRSTARPRATRVRGTFADPGLRR
jgi:CubicO group peptidase (beta-lactamase class C family)